MGRSAALTASTTSHRSFKVNSAYFMDALFAADTAAVTLE
jgi:hypothetical protein